MVDTMEYTERAALVRAAFQYVVDKLKEAVDTHGNRPVDMTNGYVMDDCGTPGCVMGWVGFMDNIWDAGYRMTGEYFLQVADEVAEKCGLQDFAELDSWLAGPGRDAWGNDWGGKWLISSSAYGVWSNDPDFNISHVITHLNGFLERLGEQICVQDKVQ